MIWLAWFFGALSLASLLFVNLGHISLIRQLRLGERRKGHEPAHWPPVTMIKPLKGLEEALEENLSTFFEQQYEGDTEILFTCMDDNDPALDLARRLSKAYPSVQVHFCQGIDGYGMNPKVSNMAGALHHARHDLVLQTDANVRLSTDYLRMVVAEYVHCEGSLLSSLVIGMGEVRWSAALENLQLNTHIAPAISAALHVAGVPCVVGKSMLFRRTELDDVGGLTSVKDVLCEDFMLGQQYEKAKRTVVLSSTPVYNLNESTTFGRFWERHSRWLKMRAVIHTGSFVADGFTYPTVYAALAALTSLGDVRFLAYLLGLVVLKTAMELILMHRLRGYTLPVRYWWLTPFREMVLVVMWIYASFSRTVTWRGQPMRVGRGSALEPIR